MKSNLLLWSCVSSFALCGAAWAQTPQGAPSTTEAQRTATTDEIVVSATKREESIQDVPISMNVFAGDELAENNISDLRTLSAKIPGMAYQDSPLLPFVTLRGFGTSTSNPGYDQTVAVYLDGIFAGRGRQFQAPFFDQARVEVLRGPQGALLGKNSSAGALNFVSAAPTEEFGAGLTATYLFERAGVDASGYVTGAVSDTLSLRAAAHMLSESEGYIYNSATKSSDPRMQVFSGRLSADWHPNENFNSLARFEYSDFRQTGTQATNKPAGPPAQIDWYTRNFAGTMGEMDGIELRSWQFSNTANLDVGDFTFVSVTGVQGFEGGNVAGTGTTNPEGFGVKQIEDWFQASQEFRVVSPKDERFEWIAGVYGDVHDYDINYKIDYSVANGAFVGKAESPFSQTGHTLSAYGTGTLHLAEQLRLIGGLRYTYGHRKAHVVHRVTSGVAFNFVSGNAQRDSIAETHWDPSVTLEYDVTPTTMVYVNWGSGSKSGAFNTNSRTVNARTFVLQPEEAEGYEVGIKSQPTDWLTLNMAAFELTLTELQTAQFVGTPPTLVAVNAAEARSRGVEWTATVSPFDGLSLSTVGTYLDAEFTDYPNAPCTFSQPASTTGCNGDGRPLSAQSKWSGSVNLDYDSEISDNLRAFFSTSATFRSRHNIDANTQNPIWGYQDGFTKVDGRIGFGGADRSWEVALVGRNIFDKRTLNSVFPWGPPFLPTQTLVLRPDPGRSVGVQLKITR